MAKTIKFNLKCDNASIRTLDDLREHFCIQDILDYYKNGLLARWLNVHGYVDELGKINNLQSTTDEDLIVQISSILNVECNENVVKESLAIIEYEKESNEIHRKYAEGLENENAFLKVYRCRYETLINEIIQNKDDYSKIKAATKTLVKDFKWMLDLNYEPLFYKMKDQAPLALLYFVSLKEFRSYYIPEMSSDADGTETLDIDIDYGDDLNKFRYYETKRNLYNALRDLVKSKTKLAEILGDNLKVYSNNTQRYWKDIEPDESKKYLIIAMEQGAMVRGLKDKNEELRCVDVNDKFVVLKGVDYKNNTSSKLFYMEV